jgi:hypothetical protein
MEKNISEILDLLRGAINEALPNEDDPYKILLLRRISSNLKSIETLIQAESWIDVPVIVRVAYDHVTRLFEYHKDPDFFTKHPAAFKLIGKGPGHNFAKKELDEVGMGLVYEFLCAFAHPDMVALLLLDEMDIGNFQVIQMIISLALFVIFSVLAEVYPVDNKILLDFPAMINGVLSYLGPAINSTLVPSNIEPLIQGLAAFDYLPINSNLRGTIAEVLGVAGTDLEAAKILIQDKFNELDKKLNE